MFQRVFKVGVCQVLESGTVWGKHIGLGFRCAMRSGGDIGWMDGLEGPCYDSGFGIRDFSILDTFCFFDGITMDSGTHDITAFFKKGANRFPMFGAPEHQGASPFYHPDLLWVLLHILVLRRVGVVTESGWRFDTSWILNANEPLG